MWPDILTIAECVSELMHQEIFHQYSSTPYPYQRDLGSILPWISEHSQRLGMAIMRYWLSLIDWGKDLSFDWENTTVPTNAAEHLKIEKAREMVRRMEDVWRYARGEMEQDQAAQKRQTDRHHRQVDFDVGDEVYLSMKPYSTERQIRSCITR